MTHKQRNSAIIDLLELYTEKNTISKAAARKALIEEGIYTKKGELRVTFGGQRKKAKATT